jgi:hypothetical protein
MKVIRGSVIQSAADVFAASTIETGLGVTDQKTLWKLIGLEVEWYNGINLVAKPNWMGGACLTRDSAKTAFLDSEVISKVTWAAHAGVAPAAVQGLPFDTTKRDIFVDQPLVANSKIYIVAISATTALVNQFRYKLYIEEMKVTELEFLKAQTGYCLC